MLGVCSEFERIAKVVLDKAEKESHSKRKRKPAKDGEQESTTQQIPAKRPLPFTPETNSTSLSTPPNAYAQGPTSDFSSQSFSPALNGAFPSPNSNPSTNGVAPTIGDFMPGPGDFPNVMTPGGGLGDFDMAQFGSGGDGSPLNVGSFQQPFVPQDLWQMPMTLEWDWADMMNNNQMANMDGNPSQHPLPQPHTQQNGAMPP